MDLIYANGIVLLCCVLYSSIHLSFPGAQLYLQVDCHWVSSLWLPFQEHVLRTHCPSEGPRIVLTSLPPEAMPHWAFSYTVLSKLVWGCLWAACLEVKLLKYRIWGFLADCCPTVHLNSQPCCLPLNGDSYPRTSATFGIISLLIFASLVGLLL